MAPGGGPEAPPPPPPLPEILAFRKLIDSSNKRMARETQCNFVKKLDRIPTVAIPAEDSCIFAMKLVERGLIGQFYGRWPSPKAVDEWV